MKKAIIILFAFIAIIAGAGCINYGVVSHQGFYNFIGIAELAITGYSAYKAFKGVE